MNKVYDLRTNPDQGADDGSKPAVQIEITRIAPKVHTTSTTIILKSTGFELDIANLELWPILSQVNYSTCEGLIATRLGIGSGRHLVNKDDMGVCQQTPPAGSRLAPNPTLNFELPLVRKVAGSKRRIAAVHTALL